MLEQAKNVALTGDHWTSVNNDNYLGVTAHFIDNEWNLQSFALTVSKTEERHYADACADHFLDVVKEWKIKEKLTTLGTDSARNMVAAARQLPFEHLPCMAHSLRRTVTVSLNDSGFHSVVAKCRKIVGHFKHSPSNAQELREQQVALGQMEESLVQDVPTRWNSTIEMVKRIQRNKSPLTTTLAQQNSNIATLTTQELAKLQMLEELLEPCRYVSELLGGEQYVSCSVVLPALCHLFRVMEPSDNDPVYVVRFKTFFTTDLAKRKESTNLTWLKIATTLDPRFKDLKCLPKAERSEVWASISNLVVGERPRQQPSSETTEKQPPKKRRMSVFLLGSSDTDTDEEEESTEQCVDRYKVEPKMDMEGCPLQWWSKREGAHARLARIARKYLSTLQPQCLVRGCSHSQATSSKRREQLCPLIM
ncbi:zinc finger BED domain-containing protein 1-like [Perca flavescens]|uniref:zinc finger BED domain-containing protein 1-like n=1 Tax=Perca flavescens TaxID=8167 RepID=UPI00106E8421|nr:zinc finger BED domain-containing protein 1-like [Perca flavescens]